MTRRMVLGGGLASALALGIGRAKAAAPGAGPQIPGPQIPLGDMHAHLYFAGALSASAKPMGARMAEGGASLVAWALVSDLLWIRMSPSGVKQVAEPKPGEAAGFFARELARIRDHARGQNLRIVLGGEDVARALKGEPSIVIATEGANFLEGDAAGLAGAHERGLRQVGLVHYTRNAAGDIQTEQPEHGGLTGHGRDLVREANRLGILVDLAHCTDRATNQALDIAAAPAIWSHSSVLARGTPDWRMVPWRARQLTLATARRIAAGGGVVGLWALRPDVGPSIEAYADRLGAMAADLGEDHVAFGTDLNGLGAGAMMTGYGDLRRVVDHWLKSGMREATIRKIAIGNYARVLAAAMARRPA